MLGIAILISDKMDLKIKKVTRDKEGHYIMIKGSIQEEDKIIVNIYAPNVGAPQYIRQTVTDIKGAIDCNAIIVGDFNTQLKPMDRSSKKKLIRKHKSFFNINLFILIGGQLLYNIVVVLPYIDMNPPRVHMCSPS